MRNSYKMKKTISMKQFIAELGGTFSKHTKQRLLEVGTRCILTRVDKNNILDLKHIEHTKFDCNCPDETGLGKSQKEFAYGQFVVKDGELFFSDKCYEKTDVMDAPMVNQVFESLIGEVFVLDEDIRVKKIDDENIDFVVDSILKVCPEVSAEHLAILAKYQ